MSRAGDRVVAGKRQRDGDTPLAYHAAARLSLAVKAKSRTVARIASVVSPNRLPSCPAVGGHAGACRGRPTSLLSSSHQGPEVGTGASERHNRGQSRGSELAFPGRLVSVVRAPDAGWR